MSEKNGERKDLGDGTGRTALVDGTVVGGYQVKFLAAGGMSVVYRGTKLGKEVVLKEVETSNTREVPSLLSEKSLLERLEHKGLVSFYSFFNEGGYYYLVVEYVPGQPLASFLQRGNTTTVEEVADWGLQLCEIFHYLHRQNPPIIYRDLKSENVMLHNGRIKLIDFGIARLHKGGDREKDTELLGSTVTASPEHYGGAETDARSDIYTLGATLYELLTGGRRLKVGAFQFAPVSELREDVPRNLEQVLAKSLEFKPENRYQTAREFRDAICVAMKWPIPADPERRRSPRSQEQLPANPRKKSPWMLLVALVLLALVGGAAFQQGWIPGGGGHTTGAVASTGSHEASLDGDLFASGGIDGRAVVFMGEDVGLFQVSGWEKQTPEERAAALAKRLNVFYRSACPSCGATALEPQDIKVGRFEATGDTVVFYAHLHGFDEIHWGPELLATVDEAQAKEFQTTPRFVASYWRDLLRDTVALSRGFSVDHSALGEELATALAKAREGLSDEAATTDNLRKVLRETTGSQSLKMRELFLTIPDRKTAVDAFGGVEGYEPLRN